MNKFSQSKYTNDAIADIVKKLHVQDEYPYEILADYADLSTSMIRQIADGNRDMKAKYFIPMAYNLADKDGNMRALKMIMPPRFAVSKTDEVGSNGCPKDEFIDGSEALHMFLNGHKATNVEVMDKGIEQGEQVLERMKAERARMEGTK